MELSGNPLLFISNFIALKSKSQYNFCFLEFTDSLKACGDWGFVLCPDFLRGGMFCIPTISKLSKEN